MRKISIISFLIMICIVLGACSQATPTPSGGGNTASPTPILEKYDNFILKNEINWGGRSTFVHMVKPLMTVNSKGEKLYSIRFYSPDSTRDDICSSTGVNESNFLTGEISKVLNLNMSYEGGLEFAYLTDEDVEAINGLGICACKSIYEYFDEYYEEYEAYGDLFSDFIPE